MGTPQFDPMTGIYTVDGQEIPRVSDIIKPISAWKYDGLDELTLEAAAERGSEIHALTQLIDNGENTYGEGRPEYEGYLDAYRAYLSEHEVTHVQRETPVYSDAMWYAGTPDAISYVNGRLSIVDYKCVASVNKIGVKAQVNAYKMAYEEMNGIGISNLYCLQLMPDGYRLYPVLIDPTEFDCCYRLWRALHKEQKRGRIE